MDLERPELWLARLANASAAPGDDPKTRLRKAIFSLLVLGCALTTLPWGLVYLVLGRPGAGALPLTLSAISLAVFLLLPPLRGHRALQMFHTGLVLVMPVALQWVLGGFVAGSACALWAILAPLAALTCYGTRASIPWFLSFVAIVAVTGVADPWLALHAEPFSPAITSTFFVTNVVGAGAFAFSSLAYFVAQREGVLRELDEEHRRVQVERAKSERLLLNVLPAEIAARLKEDDAAIADGFGSVTVLFADIVNFTKLSARITPAELVQLLNEIFSIFDRLAERHGLEKIKTIGDAYMVAGGLPTPRADHAEAVADMALEMRDALAACAPAAEKGLQVRIGVHTGPVVAGVIGKRKFTYDLWGDTVNTASRMESHGIPGSIQVSGDTGERLLERYDLEDRGVIEVKGKGPMRTFFLRGRKTPPA